MRWFKAFWKGVTQSPQGERQDAFDCAGNFTPRAQQVLSLARKEAARLHHNFVGTEHVLLGLIRLGQGTAVKILGNKGVDLEAARSEVERQVGFGPDRETTGYIPYTPRVKKVLALAAKEARAINHNYVGTEHILLGLLREGEGVAGCVLKNLGIDAEEARIEILRELDPNVVITAESGTASEVFRHRNLSKTHLEPVDTSKRYDVYCWDKAQHVMVYRNARFKARSKLLRTGEHDLGAEFLELEQSNGQTVFLSVHSVFKFCEHGSEIIGEILPPD